MSNVHDLATVRRRFVRGRADPADRLEDESPEDFAANDDTFFMGIVNAEFAAHHDKIDCACCGSKDICRMPLAAPWMFGTLTCERTGHLYGYALCKECCELRKNDPDAFIGKVDAAFEGKGVV